MADAIEQSKPPFGGNWHGVQLGNGEAWINPVAGTLSITTIYADTWRIELPCAGEAAYTAPPELSGTWVVSSFALMQGGQLSPRSASTWFGRALELDLESKRAVSRLDPGQPKHCAIARSADWGLREVGALGAPRIGLAQAGAEHFIDLDCTVRRFRYIERIDVLSNAALAVCGDDKYLLVLKKADKAAPRFLKPDEACGGTSDHCSRGQTCMASRADSGALLEQCQDTQ